jgi:hypothetical protein
MLHLMPTDGNSKQLIEKIWYFSRLTCHEIPRFLWSGTHGFMLSHMNLPRPEIPFSNLRFFSLWLVINPTLSPQTVGPPTDSCLLLFIQYFTAILHVWWSSSSSVDYDCNKCHYECSAFDVSYILVWTVFRNKKNRNMLRIPNSSLFLLKRNSNWCDCMKYCWILTWGSKSVLQAVG